MAKKLIAAWITGGGWGNSLSLNPLNLLTGRGFSDSSNLLKMLNSLIMPCTSTVKNNVELRIIVSPLNGKTSHIGNKSATSYEQVLSFSNDDFDTKQGLAKIFQATTAACAFPGLYAPITLPTLGPCMDGGAVNNAPIKYALSNQNVGHIIMAVPFPANIAPKKSLRGMSLLNHFIEILINERLYRDLKEAHSINDEVAALKKLTDKKLINAKQLEDILKILKMRKVEITEIRPGKSLSANSFSGFFSKKVRISLVADGQKAAVECLAEISSHTFKAKDQHRDRRLT